MPLRRFLIYWLPVILYCAAIFIQSSFPSAVNTRGVLLGDKLLHLMGYALLAALFFRALNAERPEAPLVALFAASVLFTALYGALDELHQAFVPSRSADLLDVAADTVGAVIGAVAAVWPGCRLARYLQKNHGLTKLRSFYK